MRLLPELDESARAHRRCRETPGGRSQQRRNSRRWRDHCVVPQHGAPLCRLGLQDGVIDLVPNQFVLLVLNLAQSVAVSHRYNCPLRWGDMDAQAHLNNAAFLDYLQEARVHYLLSGPPVMAPCWRTGCWSSAPGRVPVPGRLQRPWPGHRPVGHLGRRQSVRTRLRRLATGIGWPPGPGPAPSRSTWPRNAPAAALARGARGADRRPARTEPLPGPAGGPGGEPASAARSRCAGPTWTPTATSTTSSTSTTCRRPGSSCSPTRWAGPGPAGSEIWVLVRQDLDYRRPLDFRPSRTRCGR